MTDDEDSEFLRVALRRAAGVIQGAYCNFSRGICGEAIIARAAADQDVGEPWLDAVKRAQASLEAEWPLAALPEPPAQLEEGEKGK